MKSRIVILTLFCIALVLVAGCTSTKDMGSVQIPTTVSGKGPATFSFHSSGGSHFFHVTSTGERAGMIVTLAGTKEDLNGKVVYHKIVDNAYAEKGIDGEKRISGFVPDTYTVEVMTINDEAPWTIKIT